MPTLTTKPSSIQNPYNKYCSQLPLLPPPPPPTTIDNNKLPAVLPQIKLSKPVQFIVPTGQVMPHLLLL